MSKQKKPAAAEAQGALLALGLYLLLQFALAFLAVRSLLPESRLFPAQVATCFLSVLLGGLFSVRRTALGTLRAALTVAGGFALALLLGGFLVYNKVSWSGRGGVLLAAAAGGGILAGLLGSGRKKHRKRKGISRKAI